MKKIYVIVDGKGYTFGWSSLFCGEGCIEMEIDENHPFFKKPFSYRYVDGELIEQIDKQLAKAKELKINQLNEECNKRIVEGFEYDGYKFNFDINAQTNFLSALMLMQMGACDEIEWTCYKGEEVHRIMLTMEDLLTISGVATIHKNSMIHRFRNVLQPYVENLKTLEEINDVHWEMEI